MQSTLAGCKLICRKKHRDNTKKKNQTKGTLQNESLIALHHLLVTEDIFILYLKIMQCFECFYAIFVTKVDDE